MNVFPFIKLKFNSEQSVSSVRADLINNTEVWQNQMARMFREIRNNTFSDPRKFELFINNNKFKLRRINGKYSSNGFRPIVIGRLIPQKSGTIIKLIIRQHLITLFFLIFWLIISISFLLLFSLIKENIGIIFIVILGFVIIPYSIFLFGYTTEMKYYLQFLDKIFNSPDDKIT